MRLGFACSASTGAVGGNLCCWKKDSFVTSDVVIRPADWVDRIDFFVNLSQFIIQCCCQNFVILVYFNVVLGSEERWGMNGFSVISEKFASLVDSLGL